MRLLPNLIVPTCFCLITLLPSTSRAINHCGKDGEVVFSRECIQAMLAEKPQSEEASRAQAVTHAGQLLQPQPQPQPQPHNTLNHQPLAQAGSKPSETTHRRKIVQSHQLETAPKASLRCEPMQFIQIAEQGDLESLKSCGSEPRLLDAVDIRSSSRGRTALHWAVANNHLGVVSYLLKSGAPHNHRSRSDLGGSPIHIAAGNGQVEILKLLLTHGTATTATDLLRQTPLLRAARAGHMEAVRFLLDKGDSIEAQDRTGKTPVIAASQSGNLALLKLLVERGGDVNSQTVGGMSALHYAVMRNTAMVRFLLEAGAKTDALNNEGQSPLALAVSKGINRHWTTIQLLVEQGAPLGQRDAQGRTILDQSLVEHHLALFELLLAKGVDTSHIRLHQLKGKPNFIKALQASGVL